MRRRSLPSTASWSEDLHRLVVLALGACVSMTAAMIATSRMTEAISKG
jgi:hypothetical protein